MSGTSAGSGSGSQVPHHTDWITLDVGGRIISTSRSTFLNCPNSVLGKMFHPEATLEPARMSPEGHYRIDCDPEIFSVILNWLRYGQVLLPTTMTRHTVSVLGEYFGLTDLVLELNPPPPPPTNNQSRPPFPDIVALDVRGRKINVNRSFLTRYPNSYLAEMFSANSRYTPAQLEDGSYSIDADPDIFMVIINFLQYERIILPHIGGPTIEDISFVASQLALGNEIMMQLKKVAERESESRHRLHIPLQQPD